MNVDEKKITLQNGDESVDVLVSLKEVRVKNQNTSIKAYAKVI